MGLFTQDTKPIIEANPVLDAKASTENFEKRASYLNLDSRKIIIDLDKRNLDLDSFNEKTLEDVKILKKRSHEIKRDIDLIEKAVKEAVNQIKHLAKSSDLKNLKEGIKETHIDNMITKEQFERLLSDKE